MKRKVRILEKNSFLDPNLPLAAMRGDEKAYAEIIRCFFPIIKNMAAELFLSGGDTDDLVQEGLIGLYGAVHSFSPEKSDNFVSFAKLCIRHAMLNAVKRDNAQKNNLLNDSLPLEEQGAPGCEDPADIVLAKHRLHELYECIEGRFSPLERKVLALYLEGYSYKQIADMLGVSLKSVDNAARRGRNKLKK